MNAENTELMIEAALLRQSVMMLTRDKLAASDKSSLRDCIGELKHSRSITRFEDHAAFIITYIGTCVARKLFTCLRAEGFTQTLARVDPKVAKAADMQCSMVERWE